MHELTSIIHAALPHLSFQTRAIVDALLLSGGSVGTAQSVATSLGLPSRFGLGRLLAKEGLPPLHRLSGWMTVLHWAWEWERSGTALSRLALRAAKEPPACYRLVSRITGAPWTTVRESGVEWVLAGLVQECSRSLGLGVQGRGGAHRAAPHSITRSLLEHPRAAPASGRSSPHRAPATRSCTPCA